MSAVPKIKVLFNTILFGKITENRLIPPTPLFKGGSTRRP
jgi:hypothetical protein